MSYLAIMKVNSETNRVEKYQPFSTEEEAEAHVQQFIGTFPLAYSAVNPGQNSTHWLCDTSAETVVIDVVVDPDLFNKQRKLAYAAEFSIADQLDMQYHDQVDGTTTWKDAITAIKNANPKP